MIRRRFGPAWDSNLELRIGTCDYLPLKTQTDAMALRRGDSRSRLQKMSEWFCGCHGLVLRSLTFIAEAQALITKSIKLETPRGKPVAS